MLRASVRNPIDSFILARLESEGTTPSPEAERSTLIRRLYLDLIGLPPPPEELEAFLADHRPDAYERLVTHLLFFDTLRRESGRGIGWIWPGMRIVTDTMTAPDLMPGVIATGSSRRSTATCPSISSRFSRWPAIYYPTPPWSSG